MKDPFDLYAVFTRPGEFQYRTRSSEGPHGNETPIPRVRDEPSNRMLYQLYQPYEDAAMLLRSAAGSMSAMLGRLPMGLPNALPVRSLRAAYDLFNDTKITHERPPFGIDSVVVNGELVEVKEVEVDVTPFCTLVRFKKH